MTPEEEAQLEACLRDTLTRTTDWVKFAETKNAALLTFASAWLLALGNMALGPNDIPDDTRSAIAWAAPFVFLGATLAIISILPRLRLKKSIKAGSNPLFYDQIHVTTGAALLSEMQTRYAVSAGQRFSVQYLEDLAEQLTKNSHIASRKFRLFTWGAASVLSSILIFFSFTYGRAAVLLAVSALCGR